MTSVDTMSTRQTWRVIIIVVGLSGGVVSEAVAHHIISRTLDSGSKMGAKNGAGEAKLAPRGAQEGTKKHQSDERGDVQKTQKQTWFLSSFGC